MNADSQETLRAKLALKQRQLDLLMAIDQVRDTLPDPSAMLTGIANVTADHLQSDLCLLSLLDRETGELKLKAIEARKELINLPPDIVRDLTHQAIAAGDIITWEGQDVLPELAPGDLYLAAIPIIMGENEHLGSMLLALSQSPFTSNDLALLKTAESQIDSAVIQGYAYYDLQQRNKELETIYRIDHLRDQRLPFDEMLNHVLQELRNVIQAEMGFIMLYDQAEHRLEMRATTHEDMFRVSPHYKIVSQLADEAMQRAEIIGRNDLGDDIRSILCIPLLLNEEIIGVLGVVNRCGAHGFRAADRRLLSAIGSQMDTAIFESLERRRLRQVLGRSVGPRVMERLLASPDTDFLKGERVTLSVLYADIRNSTDLAERTEAEALVGFINDYLGQMTEIVLAHEGTLDKFVGDEVMALFSAPFPQSDHALRAVRVGLAMQEKHQAVMEAWRGRGFDPTPIGVGIATGELIVGEMGCAQRTDYTAIGRAANLGARLCSAAQGGQVLVSQATYDLIAEKVDATPVSGLRLKGMGDDVTAYHVKRTTE